LTCPTGTTLTASQVLAGVGAAAHDARGNALQITVTGLDLVDFNHSGDSLLCLHATDSAGLGAKTKVITLVIE